MKKFNSIDILILDYQKENESRKCLESVRDNFQFDKRVIFYSNGGNQDYAWDFYKEGLIDICVFNSRNDGLGVGTTDLWKIARSDWIINLQNDQYASHTVTQENIDQWISAIENNPEIGAISLAGFPCGNGIYSDRAHFINRHMLLAWDGYEEGYPDGGCGPYWNGSESYNENFIQKRFEQKGLKVAATNPPVVTDNGKYSIRENPDGSIWRHTTDEKAHWIDKDFSPKEKFDYPEMNDSEWEMALNMEFPIWGVDEKGYIPESQKPHSFKFWS